MVHRGHVRRAGLVAVLTLATLAVAAPSALAVKPADPTVSASVCYDDQGGVGQPLLVVLWSFSAPRGADQIRGYGSSDGGVSWVNFDTRGVNGATSGSGNLFVSTVNGWTGWTLARVELMRKAGSGWKTITTTPAMTVATPLDQNPPCSI